MVHGPSASIGDLGNGIRSALLPKASTRPRMEVRGEQSEATKSLRTSLAKMFELIATGGLVWRKAESILCSEDNLINGAAVSAERGKAGGYNVQQHQQ
jgi:hypothetical protein